VHEKVVNLTLWILFTIFVFGPCEALLSILIYPSASLSFISARSYERYTHALAGFLILFSGVAIKVFGL
jgi:hypothetical protein